MALCVHVVVILELNWELRELIEPFGLIHGVIEVILGVVM